MARILTPDEVRQVPRAGIIWIEFFDGELGRSTALLCAMMCKDGSLVDEEGSFYNNYDQDIIPDDIEGDCWRFWGGKPSADERKNTPWSFQN